jgi:hypothetical protein
MTTHITKKWFDGEKIVTHEIPESEVYRQEPVAWAVYCDGLIALPAFEDEQAAIKEMQRRNKKWPHNKREVRALYDGTPPAQPAPEFVCSTGLCHYKAQRQPLTDEEIDDIWNRYCDEMGEASINDAYDIARAIEAAHGIKENT